MKTIFAFSLLFSFIFIGLLSCNFNNKNTDGEHKEIIGNITSDTTSTQTSDIPEKKPMVGKRIYGDFNGDGKYEYAYAEFLKEVKGPTPMDDDGTYPVFAIKFSDEKIPTFNIGCCEATLINEGDLNGDRTDEISLFQAPMNGCSYDWRTITYIGSEWKDLLEPDLIPSIGCEGVLPGEELQDIITLEDGIVYRKSVDVNDPNTFPAYSENENGVYFDFSNFIKKKAEFKIDTSK